MMVESTLKMRKLLIYVIIILTVRYSFCLKVYHSTLPIESTEGIAGLHYIKPNNANASLANSMTFCLRINYKRMLNGDTIIWHIGLPDPLHYKKVLGQLKKQDKCFKICYVYGK